MNTKPVDLREIDQKAANIYEAVIVAAKRSRQINDQNKLEYNEQVGHLETGPEDDFDERANPDLVKISLEFEKRDKPHQKSLKELLSGELEYRYKEDQK